MTGGRATAAAAQRLWTRDRSPPGWLSPPNSGRGDRVAMPLDELAHLIDRRDAVRVAVPRRVSPREQPMAREHEAVARGIRLDGAANHHRELEARPLPRNPHDVPAVSRVELLEFPHAVGARRQSNRPVRVQVIDVRERQKCMERRVDRCRDAVAAKRAQRIQIHHLVFVRFAPVARHEPLERVEPEHGKPGLVHRAEVAAAALHGQHARELPGQRILKVELRAGVAAGEVGDAQIGAKQIRSISEHAQRINESRRFLFIPEILEAPRPWRQCLTHSRPPRSP